MERGRGKREEGKRKERRRKGKEQGMACFEFGFWFSRALCFLGVLWIVKIVCIATVLHREGIMYRRSVVCAHSFITSHFLPRLIVTLYILVLSNCGKGNRV